MGAGAICIFPMSVGAVIFCKLLSADFPDPKSPEASISWFSFKHKFCYENGLDSCLNSARLGLENGVDFACGVVVAFVSGAL
jgi:hypothetical protein